jgi:hypothetical protein
MGKKNMNKSARDMNKSARDLFSQTVLLLKKAHDDDHRQQSIKVAAYFHPWIKVSLYFHPWMKVTVTFIHR